MILHQPLQGRATQWLVRVAIHHRLIGLGRQIPATRATIAVGDAVNDQRGTAGVQSSGELLGLGQQTQCRPRIPLGSFEDRLRVAATLRKPMQHLDIAGRRITRWPPGLSTGRSRDSGQQVAVTGRQRGQRLRCQSMERDSFARRRLPGHQAEADLRRGPGGSRLPTDRGPARWHPPRFDPTGKANCEVLNSTPPFLPRRQPRHRAAGPAMAPARPGRSARAGTPGRPPSGPASATAWWIRLPSGSSSWAPLVVRYYHVGSPQADLAHQGCRKHFHAAARRWHGPSRRGSAGPKAAAPGCRSGNRQAVSAPLAPAATAAWCSRSATCTSSCAGTSTSRRPSTSTMPRVAFIATGSRKQFERHVLGLTEDGQQRGPGARRRADARHVRPPVAGRQNDAELADRPAVIVVDKRHCADRNRAPRGKRVPGAACIGRIEDAAARAARDPASGGPGWPSRRNRISRCPAEARPAAAANCGRDRPSS